MRIHAGQVWKRGAWIIKILEEDPVFEVWLFRPLYMDFNNNVKIGRCTISEKELIDKFCRIVKPYDKEAYLLWTTKE